MHYRSGVGKSGWVFLMTECSAQSSFVTLPSPLLTTAVGTSVGHRRRPPVGAAKVLQNCGCETVAILGRYC